MIRIITDSAADFSQSELQTLSVRCVPMTVSFGEDSYTDGVDLPQEIFWQRMEAGQNPKTSQPSPDAFLREFEAAKDAGDSVVCILISSALSGTMQSALIAAGMVEDLDIALVDSLTATAGQRLLVQEACRLRDAGNESAQDVAAAVRQLVPRIRKTASILYLLYIALTLVEMVLLIAGGMSFYDALLHAFATAGTGGLSTRALSIGYYNSAYIDIVVGVFMILFGVNFSLYYLILLGNIRTALRNEELRWFLGVIAFSVITIAFDIRNLYGGVGHALRYSFFQVASIISTTGFATADFNLWPEYSKFLLVLLMFVGGCAGSTAGGLKVSRVILLFKSCTIEVKKMLRPRCVENVRLDGKPVDGQTVYNAMTFFTFYIIILLIAGLIVSLDGLDFTTNFTAALSCLSNVGPGLSLVGPTGSFAIFSPLSKIVLMICMLLGRLEIFPLLLLFVPFTWRWK